MIKIEYQKQTKNNGLLYIKEIDYQTAKEMTIKNHYSHSWNTSFGKINFGIFKKGINQCLGVAVFGNLMNPNSFKSIIDGTSDNIIELNRLWVDDLLTKNAETVFLSLCFKYIKNEFKNIKFIQSFADGRLGCGTIYKAANFRYYGKTESIFFNDFKNNKTYHKVPLENTMRPIKMAMLNLMLVNGMLKSFKVTTYRYIYSLNAKDYNLINLQPLNYPEYKKGEIEFKYTHSLKLLYRTYLFFKWVKGDCIETKNILNHITKDLGYEPTYDFILKESMSKSMQSFIEMGEREFSRKYKDIKGINLEDL